MFPILDKRPISPRERIVNAAIRVPFALIVCGTTAWSLPQELRPAPPTVPSAAQQRMDHNFAEVPKRNPSGVGVGFTICLLLASLGVLAYSASEIRDGWKEIREESDEPTFAEPLPLQPDEVSHPVYSNAPLPTPDTPADVMPSQ